MGVPDGQRAGRAARLSAGGARSRVDRASRRSYMFRVMFWPLAGGFIAFVLVAVLLGWILDPSRHSDTDGHGH